MSEEQEDVQDESLRDTLEAVIEESESEADSPVESTDAPSAESATPVPGYEPAGDVEPGGEEGAEASPDLPKPPVDWDASLREGWGQLPEGVREKVLEREKQVNDLMQETAGARRAAGQMNQLFQTYGSLLAAEGASDPLQATATLFQTVSELRMGSPAQKAQKMAQLIQHYGIDINALDSALVGAKVEDPSSPELIQQAVQQAVAPLYQQHQMTMEQQNLALQQSALDEVEKFGQTHEFLNDVRQDMADLIDLAARQGREMSIEEAYNKATQLNPHIQQVMEQRRLTEHGKTTQRKMNAASSVSGAGKLADGHAGDMSMRDTISEAWDAQLG